MIDLVEPLIVGARFCGPATSANGGYICGLIAARVPHAVTVRLLKPPPLDTALALVERDGIVEVKHGQDPLAQARPGNVDDLQPPRPPGFEQAVEAARTYAGFATHPAPVCFVCGPERKPGDGLCIFPGPTGDGSMVAAPWTPDDSLDSGDGSVGDEFVWAALDCPGYVAAAGDMRPMLLGELTARIDRRPQVGEPCTVIGWRIGQSGRKHEAGTAVFDAAGALCGRARAIWIEPR